MSEPQPAYFDLARSWADERDAAARRSLRIAWTVALLAGSVAALEAVALALAMPLKRIEPIAVLVDRTTGHVEQVDLDRPRALAANEALRQSLVAQYVVARESYDPVGIRDAYARVALWSAGQARSGYIASMDRDPPSARLSPARREIALAASVKSISMLTPTSALVRFNVGRIDYSGRRTDVRPAVATLSFGFRGQPMRVEDRLVNPLGFEVRTYRVDAEAAPRSVDGAGPRAS